MTRNKIPIALLYIYLISFKKFDQQTMCLKLGDR
jgi:hypothetical protein